MWKKNENIEACSISFNLQNKQCSIKTRKIKIVTDKLQNHSQNGTNEFYSD